VKAKVSTSDVLWIPRRMHRSPAFNKLTKTAVTVYLEFKFRCQYKKAGTSGKWHHANNGELIFTYDDAVKRFAMARSTFRNCIDQLVKVGFIDIAHAGGGMMKDCSKYSISDRWKVYGKEEFIKKSRQKDERKLGFPKKDWEKRTGRKRKIKPKTSITDDTRSSIADDTSDPEKAVTSSITNATLKIDPNYYIQKGLEVLEAMHSPQYH
jgi:hypothetical protein